MLALLLAVLSVTLNPPAQTITLGQTAQVTATITRDAKNVWFSWAKTSDTGSGFSGRVVALRPKVSAPSSIRLPESAQLSYYTQQVMEWTFTKQGTYKFVITVTAPDGTTAQATATINVKRK